jgi:hypothetical protein
MEKLSEPCSYRFFETQKAWIKKRAVEQGHGSEVVYLRQLVMRQTCSRPESGPKPSKEDMQPALGAGHHHTKRLPDACVKPSGHLPYDPQT